MAPSRRTLLAAVLAGLLAVTVSLLGRVLATVFFGVTVAYVLVRLEATLRRRGLHPWWSSLLATLVAFLGLVLVLAPLAVILYLRRSQLVALLRGLPDQFVVSAFGVTYAVEAGDVAAAVAEYARDAALGLARTAPVLSAKLIVFGFVVFGLLLRREELRRGLLAPLPDEYHDIAQAFHERARETLFALYVIQSATALGTFAIGAVVFWAFGYRYPVALAGIAGILQFLPVVGPSVVVVGLAAYEASLGAYWRMSLVLLVGLGLVAVLPDAVLRPRLASRTAHLPASLYFVGFAGGVLSLGPVGIIAGPLVLGLLLEALSLLADEVGAESGASPDRH